MSTNTSDFESLYDSPFHLFIQFLRVVALLMGLTALKIIYSAVSAQEWPAVVGALVILLVPIGIWCTYGKIRKAWSDGERIKTNRGGAEELTAWNDAVKLSRPWWAPGSLGSLEVVEIQFVNEIPSLVIASTQERALKMQSIIEHKSSNTDS